MKKLGRCGFSHNFPGVSWISECAAVIPCLNEVATIGPLVEAVRRYLPTVFVIDDGSSDGTAEAAGRAGAVVARQETTLGKGAALQIGWGLAREQQFKWVLTLDGDGQHSPDDVPAFFKCAEATSARLLVGNRMPGCRKMPFLRRGVNRWMSKRISRAAGQPLPDSQCGFRLIFLEALFSIPVSARHFEIESDVLLGFARAGYRIEFVPIQVIYKADCSKIHPWSDTVRWFQWWRRVPKAKPIGPNPKAGQDCRCLNI